MKPTTYNQLLQSLNNGSTNIKSTLDDFRKKGEDEESMGESEQIIMNGLLTDTLLYLERAQSGKGFTPVEQLENQQWLLQQLREGFTDRAAFLTSQQNDLPIEVWGVLFDKGNKPCQALLNTIEEHEKNIEDELSQLGQS